MRGEELNVGTGDYSWASVSLGILAEMADFGGWVSGEEKEKADRSGRKACQQKDQQVRSP